MPSPALARLESLLGAHKLDHTLTSRLPPVHEEWPAGLPRGQISEIVGSRSSGRQTVLVSRLAAATGRGELVALVDPLDMFDPVSAAAHGVELSRMLWVRGCAGGPDRVSLPRQAGEAGIQVERAVKALNLILQASGFGLVALDLGEIPLPVLGRVPFTTWRRLHRVIEGGETACVVVAAVSVARSVGGITVALTPRDEGLHPLRSVRLFPKLTIDGRVVGSRGLGIRDSGLGIGDSRLAIRDSLTATDH